MHPVIGLKAFSFQHSEGCLIRNSLDFEVKFVSKVNEEKKNASGFFSIEMNNPSKDVLLAFLECFTSLPSPSKSTCFCNMNLLLYYLLPKNTLIPPAPG